MCVMYAAMLNIYTLTFSTAGVNRARAINIGTPTVKKTISCTEHVFVTAMQGADSPYCAALKKTPLCTLLAGHVLDCGNGAQREVG